MRSARSNAALTTESRAAGAQVTLDDAQLRVASGDAPARADMKCPLAAAADCDEGQFDVQRRRAVGRSDVQHLVAARAVDARQREVRTFGWR